MGTVYFAPDDSLLCLAELDGMEEDQIKASVIREKMLDKTFGHSTLSYDNKNEAVAKIIRIHSSLWFITHENINLFLLTN